jgi:hypothetical protein
MASFGAFEDDAVGFHNPMITTVRNTHRILRCICGEVINYALAADGSPEQVLGTQHSGPVSEKPTYRGLAEGECKDILRAQ